MISFVIPLYNEVENLSTLHAELTDVVASAGLGDVEFLFVDDGSIDGSWRIIENLARGDDRVRGIRLRRNFGKAAALAAGFAAARGGLVFTLDADLQDDPAEVPRFLAKLDEGRFDLLSGWKVRRRDPWHKVGPSRLFNKTVSLVSGCRLHDHNCGYKLYRRAVLDEVKIYGELHRFIPVLAAARGFRVGEIEVNHRSRRFGVSKYGLGRFLKGLLDLLTVTFLTRYGSRPLHAIGTASLAFLLVGTLGLISLALGRALGWWEWPFVPLVLATGAVVVGVQFLVLGLVAELVISRQIDATKTYSVDATIGPQATREALP
jgi:glycosyltransferase involved in cell wall biosynthesis